jgi:MOSC domain-containing protein YiiM
MSPVAHPVMIEPVALDGDEQADLRVHRGPDKAVYTYGVDDYAWWTEWARRQLDRETA